ncbi:MAG: mitochondrial fission ELM1 family protein [Xanthomonadaceae bacterium]|nr:mitochondrial fission ELM1 family protein [Xanthomonadaceae bacterium]
MQPFLWTVTDHHSGNVRQAQALATALTAHAPHQTLHPVAPWRWFAPYALPGAARAFGPRFTNALSSPPTLAIGCGRQAALATRLLRRRGTRVVQILDPRIGPQHWDLVIVPEHDGLQGGNVIRMIGSLNPVDAIWLENARRQFSRLAVLPSPRTAWLIGGPTRHAPWTAADFEQQLASLADLLRQQGGSIMATVSRRTPLPIRARLRQWQTQQPGMFWQNAEEDGVNPYPGLLGWADRLLCTPDSVNMLSETCATDRPVFVSCTERVHGRLRKFLDTLSARERIRPFDDTLAAFSVTPLRETARIAAIVRERLAL